MRRYAVAVVDRTTATEAIAHEDSFAGAAIGERWALQLVGRWGIARCVVHLARNLQRLVVASLYKPVASTSAQALRAEDWKCVVKCLHARKWLLSVVRFGTVLALFTMSACGGGDSGVGSVTGSGKRADCDETPAADLDGSEWFDTGTVTVLTDGCSGAEAGDQFTSCALNWKFSQEGNDVTIVVDNEYRVLGRLCGDALTLEGGWWLPVEDEGSCTYAEDSAEEVGIEAEGNALTVNTDEDTLTGTLVVRSACTAEYDVVFYRLR